MAATKTRNRAVDFDDLIEAGVKELDPEGDDTSDSSDDSGDELGADTSENAGREHYADIGKSKIRKPKTAPLGPQYRGSRISRDTVEKEDEEENDPFDEEFEESDEGQNGRLGVRSGDATSSEDSEEVDSGTDDTDVDAEPAGPQPNGMATAQEREIRKSAVAKDCTTVASSLSQSVKKEAEKGRAVKRQRAAFDNLLGARIKMQKSLVATNTLVGLDDEDFTQQGDIRESADAAEAAAFNLWSSLNAFREEIQAHRTSSKRKRASFTADTPTETLWTHMQDLEDANIPHRNVALQLWSTKTEKAQIRAHGSIDGKKSTDQMSIMDTIQQHLTGSDNLMRKAHTPRSCAPLQLANKVEEDPKIYDDADFYGLMLKEVLESKSSDSLTASTIDFDSRREAKTKKHVDTKASKGRKLRYTVHEKLQNFMAPEDRRRWGDRQADELFGSLFGRKMELGEDGGADEEIMDAGDGEDGAEELMLFRT